MEDMENSDNQDFKMPKQLFVDSCNEAFVVLKQVKKEKIPTKNKERWKHSWERRAL